MAHGYGYVNMGNVGSSVGDEDFEEEDVWAVVKERKETESSPKIGSRKPSKDSSMPSGHRRIPSASRMIPRTNNPSADGGRTRQQSAPVNIPDWSKIYRMKGLSDGYRNGYGEDNVDEVGGDHRIDGEDDDDDDMIPPHEWIAKKLARSQISSFSVCEGAGRTLKGRDLSKVRNAVLTKTGFLE